MSQTIANPNPDERDSNAPQKSVLPASARFYGWKPSLPDIRDRKLTLPTAAPLVALPPSVMLNRPFLPAPFNPSWDQGSLGSCGPQTLAKDIVYAAMKQDVAVGTIPMPSRLFIYYNTRRLMGTVNEDSGVDNRTLMKSVAKYGWCDESLWPYEIRNFKKEPPSVCYQQGATRRLVEYLAVPQNLLAMKTCLANGDPFVFGFTVYESFESPDVARTGRITFPQQSERAVGGHDVLVTGYRDDLGCFVIDNSWNGWGEDGTGTAYFPYAYATHPQLAGDFWTIRTSLLQPGTGPNTTTTASPGPLPPPVPPPAVDEADLSMFGLPYLLHKPAALGDDFGLKRKTLSAKLLKKKDLTPTEVKKLAAYLKALQ